MKHLLVISCYMALVFSVSSCGVSHPKKKQNVAQNNNNSQPVTKKEENISVNSKGEEVPPPPEAQTQPEGDFSGHIVIDQQRNCLIQNGNDTDGTVSCQFEQFSQLFWIRLDYEKLGIANSPACIFQGKLPDAGTVNVKDLNNKIATIYIENRNARQPQQGGNCQQCCPNYNYCPQPCLPHPCDPWSTPYEYGNSYPLPQEQPGQQQQQLPGEQPTIPNVNSTLVTFYCKISG